MPIQPYFPEPITVPGNVADAKHRVRVAFVRRVVGWHCVSMCLVLGLAVLMRPVMSAGTSGFAFLVCLIALTMVRRAFNGTRTDSTVSSILLLPTMFTLSQLLRQLYERGWPVVILVPVVLSLGLYVLLCGNDLSYIGQFCLCAGATLITIAIATLARYFTPWQGLEAALFSLVHLFYFVYDLSMLVKRRTNKEEFAAVADLFRDLLNFATYSVRVYLHWRRFRLI